MFKDCTEIFIRDVAKSLEKRFFVKKSLVCVCLTDPNVSISYAQYRRPNSDHSSDSLGVDTDIGSKQCKDKNNPNNENTECPNGMYFVCSGVVNIVEKGARSTAQKQRGNAFAIPFIFDNIGEQKNFYVRTFILCCIALHRIVLCCIVLCCIVLYFYCVVLYCIVLYCIVLYCIVD